MSQTLTISERVMKPGIGYVPFSSSSEVIEDPQVAQDAFEVARQFWADGSEVIEREGTTVEFQVGGWRRVMVDLS